MSHRIGLPHMRFWTLVRRAFPFAVVTAVAVAALVATPDTAPTQTSQAAAPRPATLHELDIPATPAPDVPAASAAPAATPSPSPSAQERSEVRQQAVPPATTAPEKTAPEKTGTDEVATLPRTTVRPFSMVGVTWARGGEDFDVKVALRKDGRWSTFQTLDTDRDAEADAGPEVGRAGTDPLWVGSADGVAVRVTSPSGQRPADLKVATIDPGRGSDVAPAAATVGQPKIISRSSWGAKGPTKGNECSAPVYGASTLGAVIHHTAGSNDYTKAQSAGIVRATQAYHTGARGWCDIGYNFLVDKYGQIFEGRRGGIAKQVRAAHSGNGPVNERTVGISMMGTYSKVAPTAATKKAVADLVAWRFSLAKLKATGTYSLGGLRLNRIVGHRDVLSTECPGAVAYAWVTSSGSSGLRQEVARRLAGSSTPKPPTTTPTSGKDIKSLAAAIGSEKLGKLLKKEWGNSVQRRAIYQNMDLLWTKAAGAFSVTSVVRREWHRTGEQGGRLGFPTSSRSSTGDANVKYQRFQKGSVYIVGTGSATKAYAIYGPIFESYKTVKGTSGPLGAPTSTVRRDRTGYQRVTFAKGYMEYSEGSRTVSTWYKNGSSPDQLTVPKDRSVVINGRGFGHGIGMSQYGAQGAARSGKTFKQILASYYPGTSLAQRSGSIRVLVGDATSSTVTVRARSGLVFRTLASSSGTTLPTSSSGTPITNWRIRVSTADATKSVLEYRAGSRWRVFRDRIWRGSAQFQAPSLGLVLPNGSVREYRTAIRSALPASGAKDRKTVNVLSLDDYTRGVVASEMPSSWQQEALKAQAVAARTYAVRTLMPSRYYDVCDTTSCQVFKGLSGETANTDKAVAATRGSILTYQGKPALTQYSSSSGGASAPGSAPYLKAHLDPWDGWSGNANRSWRVVVKAASIERAFPKVGTLRSLTVTQRDGTGDWKGRVVSIRLTGSKGTQTVSGPDLRFALGLKSHYFRLG
ncbi:MAG: SpoIID/LytB domain-containing protein [Propionibacteriales bacterium]|nr:SpoIID/LytB domain-containing protein [Propionibacteriales bacterium]